MQKVKNLFGKVIKTFKEEGLVELVKRTFRFIKFKLISLNAKYDRGFKDVLFINGCSLPHPERYRVDHQIEQLESYGLSCDKVYYADLKLDMLNYYRGFVFYRCPILPVVEEFIKQAKDNNKTIFYDIDDLVYDLKHTNMIKFLDTMSKNERDLYNEGVVRMGKTLKMCEYGITSTTRLQKEMSKDLKDVYVNRNVASEDMVKYSERALNGVKKDPNKIVIGYLSGSITHNDDFKLVMAPIVDVLKKYDNVYLKVVGLLDIPEEMEEVKYKIITAPFMDWKELPRLIRSIDINIAPLEDTIFNEAKSENKWTEAALVKIPTIASNVGAFKESIIDGENGLLCDDTKDWKDNLVKLIENRKLRENIGNNAYDEVINNHVTTSSGYGIAQFIKSKLRKNVCFVLPSPNVSGGVMVAIKHAVMLKENGYDVTMININKQSKNVDHLSEGNDTVLVVPKHRTEFLAHVDTIVATMWLTLEFVQKYYNSSHKKYLVQNMETKFYEYGLHEKRKANSTYCNCEGIEYITISKWCQDWLKKDFGVTADYAPNGIDLSIFKTKKRSFSGKTKILIEGNCNDHYKNVDESFKIANKLDKTKYEIHYLSYQKEPKKWYRVDKFYHKVPHDEVGKIYENADILLKTSVLESFSYPPLEMMATGGAVVVLPNGGNVEYLIDNQNCLFYEQGNYDMAVEKLEEIVSNKELRNKLIANGLKTAKLRQWSNIKEDIIKLYK